MACVADRIDANGKLLEPDRFTVTYRGAAEGTLELAGGSWRGSVTIPASRETREQIIGIRAAGKAAVHLPDKDQVKACYNLALKTMPGAAGGGEINISLALSCMRKAKIGAAPAAAIIRVSVGLENGEVITYFSEIEPSGLSDADTSLLVMPSFPLPRCTVVK